MGKFGWLATKSFCRIASLLARCQKAALTGGELAQGSCFFNSWINSPLAFLVAQMVKNLSATQVTPIQSLGWEDPLEKGTATHFNILAWRIPWTEEPEELQSMERVRHDWATDKHTCTHLIKLWRLPELHWELKSLRGSAFPRLFF